MTTPAEQATTAVRRWLDTDHGAPTGHDARAAIDQIGRDVQDRTVREAAERQNPLDEVATHCADGGAIADALVALRDELTALDPSSLDTESSWLTRAISKIPGVGTPAERYAQRLESARSRINSIARTLEDGRAMLSRDNVTLRTDHERLRALSTELDAEIAAAQAYDDALVFGIDVELAPDDERRPLFEDELLPRCRRRITDLEHVALLNRQATSAVESAVASNRGLIDGIDRTRDLTLSALAVAAAAGRADGRRQSVPGRHFDAIDDLTADVVSGTERRLRRAPRNRSGPSGRSSDRIGDVAALRAAFDEVERAVESTETQRAAALRPLRQTTNAGPDATHEQFQEIR